MTLDRLVYNPDDPLAILRNATDLMARDFPPVQWAVPGIMPEGYVVLAGAPKVGKSWLSLAMLVAIARGGNALGVIDVGPARPVLHIALEDNSRRMQRRIRQLGGATPNLFDFQTGEELPDHHAITFATAWLEQHRHERPVVCIDTLGRIMRAALPGQGTYERDYRLGATLKNLAEVAPGSTVLAVHHTRKALGEGDWMETVSGTNGVNGAADATLVITRKRGEEAGRLSITGRDIENDGTLALTRDATSQGMSWVLDGSSIEEAMQRVEETESVDDLGDTSKRIVEYVGKHLAGVGPKDVARDVRVDYDLAKRYLARLADSGSIRKTGRGRYTPVSPVSPVSPSGDGDTGDTGDTGLPWGVEP